MAKFCETVFPILATVLLGAILILLVVLLITGLSRKTLQSLLKKNRKDIKEECQDMLDGMQDVVLKEMQDEFWKNEKRIGEVRDAQGELENKLLRSRSEEQQRLFENLNRQSKDMTELVSGSLTRMQESNEKKLEEMRQTVDEKLTKTLGDRLDDSFKAFSEQLGNVYNSLNEMKKLGEGVTDLQRVLTNVKARGTWAEVQLGSILEQTLIETQYARNVSPRNNSERVEFAVKIPSRDESDSFVWLPIDSKFPQEDYLRILDASERADKAAMESACKSLEQSVKGFAKTISSLYIEVPLTTDFAIMFLPTEGLYAEVLRRPGLSEEIQQKYRVMICGPTTITAFLNTLRVGFRTIALDKQSAEVRKLLEATKAQYEKFNDQLTKARRKIDEAGKAIDDAQNRSGIIHKKLKGVDSGDSGMSDTILGITADSIIDEEIEDSGV